MSGKLTNTTSTYIITHYLFERKSHTVHLVFFYERSKSGIWWHGSLFSKHSLAKGDVETIDVNKSQVILGRSQGIYDK